jgi:hypothetical protein
MRRSHVGVFLSLSTGIGSAATDRVEEFLGLRTSNVCTSGFGVESATLDYLICWGVLGAAAQPDRTHLLGYRIKLEPPGTNAVWR